jgi:hypothetical protein
MLYLACVRNGLYSETCLIHTSLQPAFILEIEKCLAYTG